jgi:spore maturation protein CgeB
MRIAFFGSSLVSAYWNGAATYYRGIIRALHDRGHRITFYEPDVYDRQRHRDIPDPDWATSVVYPGTEAGVLEALGRAGSADLVVKASGVGVFDELLEAAVLDLQSARTLVAYWDVDAPATLDRVASAADDPLRALVPRYDAVFTYGGGDPVVRGYLALGARGCVPIYNALDPSTHHPVAPEPAFMADLAFLGNRLPDREARVNEYLVRPAARLPQRNFVLGGSGWDDAALPANVRYVGHVYTAQHNAFNCSPSAVLNVSRESMARYGHSPATRIFEAAGAGACVISDSWPGIDQFLEPGREILTAPDGDAVADHVERLDVATARRIGEAARRRVNAEHTYAHRAAEVEAVLEGRHAAAPVTLRA